ncbi:MAG: CHAT domain-containing protein [Proteobacteria bacterium]|nr:CHAT domain-containing protein [Pseudomonadota bacterium]
MSYNSFLTRFKEIPFLPHDSDLYKTEIDDLKEILIAITRQEIPLEESAEYHNHIKRLISVHLFLQHLSPGKRAFCAVDLSEKTCSVINQYWIDGWLFHLDKLLSSYSSAIDSAAHGKGKSRQLCKQALSGVLDNLLELRQDINPTQKIQTIDYAAFAKHLDKIHYLMSMAYLGLARLVPVKAISVSQKKIEALKEALRWLNEIKDGSNDSVALRIEIGLELLWLGKQSIDLEEMALLLDENMFAESQAGRQLVLYLAESEIDKSYINQIIKSDEAKPLEKARAALILNDYNISKYTNDALEIAAKKGFQDRDWDELTNFIIRLARSNHSDWKHLARKAWEKCAHRESITLNNLYLRQFWAKQRDLYDLAFHATEDSPKKIEIIDKLKSRPALRHSAIEKISQQNEGLRKLYDMESAIYGNYYYSQAEQAKWNGIARSYLKLPAFPSLNMLPANWLSVHFYISTGATKKETKDKGYAFVTNSDGDVLGVREFKSAPIWKAFQNWQDIYFTAHGNVGDYSNLNKPLEVLCQTVGQELNFLFDNSLLPEGRPVVFIPFDFMHKLPLHMAINSNGELWAKRNPCAYLPSWHLLHPPAVDSKNAIGKKICLHHFEENLYQYILREENPLALQDIYDPVQIENWNDEIINNPTLLLLLCHGLCHPINPLETSLIFSNGYLTNQMILESSVNLAGTRIILGACETDTTPPATNHVDEHLSVTSVLLTKGASEILGGLWALMSDQIERLAQTIGAADEQQPLYSSLWAYYQELPIEYIRNNLFKTAPFRVAGLPIGCAPPARDSEK